ncbi:DUF21 domain-containing protein At4g33700-like isoform X2 [Arachis ipaensis]|nr:DUF21 domain-containing protein At4g33700-like isoform X2 [Arachis ipaensis]XP_025636855.1 DUF21 domain-containing protein At4g33700 isoform X2 [Arachis hypogaea]
MHEMYASNVNVTGLCRTSQLKVADFSYNFFVGSLPKCLHVPRSSFQGNCPQIKDIKQRTSVQYAKIMLIIKNEHLLLGALLVAKSLALEGVSLFMEKMFPEWLAIIISATLLGIIAKIIPQVLCSRYGLSVAATVTLFVKVLLLIFFLIAYPISKVLDWLFGKGHSALLGREELKTLVHLHSNEAGKGGELSLHEATIIAGALDLTLKTVKDAMTPISEIFSLDINSNSICETWPLYEILNQFQKGQSHMAVAIKGEVNIKDAATYSHGLHAFEMVDYTSISTDASNLTSQETEYYSATLKNAMKLEGDSDALRTRSQHESKANVSFEKSTNDSEASSKWLSKDDDNQGDKVAAFPVLNEFMSDSNKSLFTLL